MYYLIPNNVLCEEQQQIHSLWTRDLKWFTLVTSCIASFEDSDLDYTKLKHLENFLKFWLKSPMFFLDNTGTLQNLMRFSCKYWLNEKLFFSSIDDKLRCIISNITTSSSIR